MSLTLSVAPNSRDDKTTRQHEKRCPSLAFITASLTHPARHNIETFIANGFATRYDAHISSFMPMLFALEVNGIKAAVGTRCCATHNTHHALFIEQYLDIPIEVALEAHEIFVQRGDIVEVGNLFSSSSRYTLPLLLSLFFLFSQVGKKYLVFSATTQVQQLLQGAGISLTTLAHADVNKLAADRDDWGSYYDTAPQVMALSLQEVTHHVMRSSSLRQYYQQAVGLIASTDAEHHLRRALAYPQTGASHVA